MSGIAPPRSVANLHDSIVTEGQPKGIRSLLVNVRTYFIIYSIISGFHARPCLGTVTGIWQMIAIMIPPNGNP